MEESICLYEVVSIAKRCFIDVEYIKCTIDFYMELIKH